MLADNKDIDIRVGREFRPSISPHRDDGDARVVGGKIVAMRRTLEEYAHDGIDHSRVLCDELTTAGLRRA